MTDWQNSIGANNFIINYRTKWKILIIYIEPICNLKFNTYNKKINVIIHYSLCWQSMYMMYDI